MNGDWPRRSRAAWAFGARDIPLAEVVGEAGAAGRQRRRSREGPADYLPAGVGAGARVRSALDNARVRRRRLRSTAGLRRPPGPRRASPAPRGATPPAGSARDVRRSRRTSGRLGSQEGRCSTPSAASPGHGRPARLPRHRGDGRRPPRRLLRREPAWAASRAWLGNEPSFPPRGPTTGSAAEPHADVVDRAQAELWSLTPAGLPGNDDLGAPVGVVRLDLARPLPLTPFGCGRRCAGLRPGRRPPARRRRADHRPLRPGRHVASVTVDDAGRPSSARPGQPGDPGGSR